MSDLDTLYSEVLLKSPDTFSPGDIDTIIAYQRTARERFNSGGKAPKKAEGPKLDLSNIVAKPNLVIRRPLV